jgi:DNA-binding transcriptional ArsR family regulator
VSDAHRDPELDRTLAALADPNRRAVIDLLRARPHRAGELSSALALTPPAMSRHLRVLRSARLVEEAPQGDDARVRVYRLRRERWEALRSWIEEVEGFWADQLGAFREHAERTRGAGSGAAAKKTKRAKKVSR